MPGCRHYDYWTVAVNVCEEAKYRGCSHKMPYFILDFQPQIQNSLDIEYSIRNLEDYIFVVAHLRVLNNFIAPQLRLSVNLWLSAA